MKSETLNTGTAKNYKTFFENTIIDNIDFEGYNLPNDGYLYDRIKTLYNIFNSEYGFMIERVGERKAFCEWLQGLPSSLTVPFNYYDILTNAKNYGIELDTEEKENKFLDEYFMNLSNAFFTLKENL